MATRRNLCPNPAADNNVTGWSGGETPVRTDVTGQGFPRTWAARYSTSSFMFGPTGAASAGSTYAVSVYVRPQNFTVGGTLAIQWLDASSNEISETTAAFPTAPTGTATRVSITGTAPAGTVSFRLLAFGENYASNPCSFTAVLYEQGASVGTYFDGNTAGASWDGTAGNSTSTLADATAVAVSGRSVAAVAARATARKVVAVTAVTSLTCSGTAGARKAAPASGVVAAASSSTVTAWKVAPASGRAVAIGLSLAGARKRAPGGAVAAAAAWSYRSQVLARPVAAVCSVAPVGVATVRKVTAAGGQSWAAACSSSAVRHVAAVLASSVAAAAGRVQVRKTVTASGGSILAATLLAGGGKLAPVAGRSYAALSAVHASEPEQSAGLMFVRERPASMALKRDRDGSSMATHSRRTAEMEGA